MKSEHISIVAVNATDEEHLECVTRQMVSLGVPAIRAIWSETYGLWFAIEGSHRLAAAHNLGLVPEVIDVTGESIVTQKDGDDEVSMTAEEVEEWLTSDVRHAIIFDF